MPGEVSSGTRVEAPSVMFRWCGRAALAEFRQPEIQNLHVTIGPQHDVFRFDVAMNDALAVSVGERRRNLLGDTQPRR